MENPPTASSLNTGQLWMTKAGREDPEAAPAARETALLIERAIRGDKAAFGEIVIRHERRVLTLAWRLLGTMEDAQDAAQDVFLRAFKYLRRFDNGRPIEPWLVGLTVNVCRALGRKRQRHRSLFVHAPDAEQTDARRDPYAELDAGQHRDILYHALDGLGEKERAALVLRDLEGLSTAEVAGILGSSEATIRVQVSVARLKIRKAIQQAKGGPR